MRYRGSRPCRADVPAKLLRRAGMPRSSRHQGLGSRAHRGVDRVSPERQAGGPHNRSEALQRPRITRETHAVRGEPGRDPGPCVSPMTDLVSPRARPGRPAPAASIAWVPGLVDLLVARPCWSSSHWSPADSAASCRHALSGTGVQVSTRGAGTARARTERRQIAGGISVQSAASARTDWRSRQAVRCMRGS
jgi:hypothetical protein